MNQPKESQADKEERKAVAPKTPEECRQVAREVAAQCWLDPETAGIEMDTRLAEAFARRLASEYAYSGGLATDLETVKRHLDACRDTLRLVGRELEEKTVRIGFLELENAELSGPGRRR